MKLVDATLFLRAAGEIIFDVQIRNGAGWESVLCACIGAVYLFLPMDDILTFFHEEKFRAEEKPYREVKATFIENYYTMHPLYAKERYALISGMEIVTQVAHPTNQFFFTENKEFNETKEEMFNSLDNIRQPRGELNEVNET